MPDLITNLSATTELEAVNAMLAAIGEAPITDLSAGQSLTDVAMATNELRKATREVQTLPWKFNTRLQVPLNPLATLPWTDPDGTVQTLNVFVLPPAVVSFTASPIASQLKYGRPLDLVAGPAIASEVYGGATFFDGLAVFDGGPDGTMVIIDRTFNRDGLIAADYPKLYIDAVYLFNFTQLPESARQYVTVLAGRRFIQNTVGSQELVGFKQQDEAIGLRTLKRDQGSEDDYNLLENPDVSRVFGMRPRTTGPFTDLRRGR